MYNQEYGKVGPVYWVALSLRLLVASSSCKQPQVYTAEQKPSPFLSVLHLNMSEKC